MNYLVQFILSGNNVSIQVTRVFDILNKYGITQIEMIKGVRHSAGDKNDLTIVQFEFLSNEDPYEGLRRMTKNELISYKVRILKMSN